MKYIVIKNSIGRENLIAFSPTMTHKQVAKCMCGTGDSVVSAGFVRCFQTEMVQCSGESTTLCLRSRKEDTDLLRASLDAI